ncbi:hypothetical protein D0962_03645 [Leptolyngbyaceae cyanobacterium CCMR0082]|uniref:Uncharacterized protein n=2 Tax=Adonisia turfae TaxID=2950184 RepID=A0A6M0S096_9CYAN|nr:hypothetical protein [Adonisia turfae]MDV3352403.1 hypothetical protein [Leptothoe sp. LEGE 181152]NEZ58908.1 hypothetical protein [Adonisia turfae CCMR0081]NEZ61874.1 hypothetical protein [Adonisia turfae CCMR0082]
MQPVLWLLLALGMTALGYRLRHRDEVYALALYIVALLSGLWGFSLVPSTVQLTMGAIAIGWLQMSSRRN